MTSAIRPERISRGEFLVRIERAVTAGHGFAAGKIGQSEKFLLHHPMLHASAQAPMQQRAAAMVLGFHAERQSGLFPRSTAFYSRFADFYADELRELDVLGLFGARIEPAILTQYGLNVTVNYYRDQEPGRSVPDDPENCYLPFFNGKRLLIVSPFAPLLVERANRATFEAVWAKTGKRWFEPTAVEGMIMPYGWAPETQERFADSVELLNALTKQMSALRFDVALISAGALGIPLAVHAKRMGAVAISLGGHLQVLFGVLGKRWRDSLEWQRDYINPSWVDVPEEMLPKQPLLETVDGGAYW